MGARKDKNYRLINGVIYARFVFTDRQGKRREKHLRAENKRHAQQLHDQMEREYRDHDDLQYLHQGLQCLPHLA
jgi:hypothetical protein